MIVVFGSGLNMLVHACNQQMQVPMTDLCNINVFSVVFRPPQAVMGYPFCESGSE